MLVIIKDDYEAVSQEAARLVADRLHKKPSLVLGLATGSTPLGLYRELIRMHADEGLDFSKVTTFNLDEYVGLPPDHPQSYHRFMRENFFDHINADPRFVHIPDGMVTEIEAHCQWYEAEIERSGGIDLQVLGIGANGHIAFNEPGSSLGSRTRVKTLSRATREDNARFFRSIDEVPRHAITMGIGTILEAQDVLLMACGDQKAAAIQAAVEGPLTASAPASMIQMHRNAFVIVDRAAASRLSDEHATALEEAVLFRRPISGSHPDTA
ncbi:MAG: glucosamine-6-phosphate deaminase [Gemmatimonadales bacterium]|nr:glucosamine-6-phosphate deaminase [Gemmatimonadales bacterium]NIN12181.1 glucosamine-6-phosphate deaminase [Gemmatimonadales bacterium]NIN50603.1 glucosamine-6-phosphate deaminase [Gemmatimonadales bacterium]NIP08067.1 glucosamine-6-phosphate deaminase [Gemmatimonadales bacterium]NIR00649.1 glucosamine-6-phosphate deaminase [Gemmatimonadales bacterium]